MRHGRCIILARAPPSLSTRTQAVLDEDLLSNLRSNVRQSLVFRKHLADQQMFEVLEESTEAPVENKEVGKRYIGNSTSWPENN